MSRIERAYLICATPRSGSTLLCDLLENTGVAGHPAEYFEALRSTGRPRQPRQYFEDLDDPAVLDLLPPVDPGTPEVAFDLDAVLTAGTTPNGVFGAKVMWAHLDEFRHRLGEVELPQLRHVRVTRRDKVAQAVSLWTAIQTQRWRHAEGDAPEPVYSYAAIRHLVLQLSMQDAAWFELLDDPVVVIYEELAARPAETIARVLSELGVEGDAPEPRLRRQADERSRGWIDRYVNASEAVMSSPGEAGA